MKKNLLFAFAILIASLFVGVSESSALPNCSSGKIMVELPEMVDIDPCTNCRVYIEYCVDDVTNEIVISPLRFDFGICVPDPDALIAFIENSTTAFIQKYAYLVFQDAMEKSLLSIDPCLTNNATTVVVYTTNCTSKKAYCLEPGIHGRAVCSNDAYCAQVFKPCFKLTNGEYLVEAKTVGSPYDAGSECGLNMFVRTYDETTSTYEIISIDCIKSGCD